MSHLKKIVEDRLMGVLVPVLAFVLTAGLWMPVSAQQIMIDGTTGMLPLAKDLVQAFKAKNPSVSIELGRGSPSESAVRAVTDGRLGIGLSSIELGDAEHASGLQSIEIARTAVVFAVNGSVKIPGLTAQQVCDIYAGKIKNWKEVGGIALPIIPLTRPANETDPQIIKKQFPCFREGEGVLSLSRASEMAKTLSSKAGAIGMTNAIYVEESSGAIRALTLNGISPTPENIQGGSYPLVRRFYLVVKGKPTGDLGQFLAFVKSTEGQSVIRENKAVPVK
jgi:phosphate transport system substrate-binding protein